MFRLAVLQCFGDKTDNIGYLLHRRKLFEPELLFVRKIDMKGLVSIMRLPVWPVIVLLVSMIGAVSLADVAKEKTVIAEGTAAFTGSDVQGAVRHAALADALRRAIEKACGVSVDAETRTKNFALTHDTISTSSEGFIKDYRIIGEGQRGGVYSVKIEATVAPGSPVRPLELICKALKAGPNPLFKVSVDGASGRTISGELSRLGLRIAADSGIPTIEIRGEIKTSPSEEAGFFSSMGSTDISVIDCTSSTIMPSVEVGTGWPVISTRQQEADRLAAEKASKLWVQRNVPLIAAALLGPDHFRIEGASNSSAVDAKSSAIDTAADSAPPAEGDFVGELVWKLSNNIKRNPAFPHTPIKTAVFRFRSIDMPDESASDNLLEDLQTAMAKTGMFEIVERNEFDRILKELKIQNSGLIDSETAKRLGKLTGAESILVGSLSNRKDRIVINARLVSTESGRVQIAESVSQEKDPEPVVLRAGPQR